METKIQFEGFKECLKEKIERKKTVADFLPTEHIKVVDMLINAECKCDENSIVKPLCEYNIFDISELRQIAEHLLVYCNANGEGEE